MKALVHAAAIAAAALASPSFADTAYPGRPLTIVVPFAAGGGVDILTRQLAQGMSARLGQDVIVQNVTGAGGNVGVTQVAKAAPDGYTLVMATTGTHTISPAIYPDLPFDVERDFAPISLVASVPNLLVVNAKIPVSSLTELIALAKSAPGKYSFGSFGNGTSNHLSGELLKQMADIDVMHVPYKSAPQAVTDLRAGHTDFAFVNMPLALPHVKAGALTALAVTGARRSQATPQYATMDEAGLPGFAVESWYGLMAPAGTPDAVVARLHEETVAALRDPQMKAFFNEQGADVLTSTPDEFADTIRTEKARWAELVATSGARID